MGGETVVIDNKDVAAIVREAEVSGALPGTAVPRETSAEPPKEEAKASEPAKEEPKPAEASADDKDDVEGDDGLTPRNKRELTRKMQTAISRKHFALKEAEEFASEQYNERRLAEQRADALQREINGLKTQLPAAKAAEDTKPKREDFANEEAWRDAVDDWRVDQKFKAREAEQAAAARKAQEDEVIEQAAARIERAKELVPDFALVTDVKYQVPPAVGDYMHHSEMIAELAYHFSKHPEELTRLSKLTPARALVEVARIESKLEPFAASDGEAPAKDANSGNGAEKPSPPPSAKETSPKSSSPKPAEKPAVKPQAPITPLTGTSATQVEKPPEERTAAEEFAAWQKKHRVNLIQRQRH
jgi:hypothetical protein